MWGTVTFENETFGDMEALLENILKTRQEALEAENTK